MKLFIVYLVIFISAVPIYFLIKHDIKQTEEQHKTMTEEKIYEEWLDNQIP